MKQIVGNACGTVGLLHAIGNNKVGDAEYQEKRILKLNFLIFSFFYFISKQIHFYFNYLKFSRRSLKSKKIVR